MKKAILSVGTIFVFIAYSFQQRSEVSQISIKPPSNLKLTSINSNSTQTAPSSTSSSTSTSVSKYKDGTYTGSVADAYYGYIQVQATVQGGKITDVVFLQYPNDQANSQYINSQAMPYLKQEAIQVQSAQVDIISGATDTSNAFIQSLTDALNKAQT